MRNLSISYPASVVGHGFVSVGYPSRDAGWGIQCIRLGLLLPDYSTHIHWRERARRKEVEIRGG